MKKARLVEEVQKVVNDLSVRNLVEQRVKEFQALKGQNSMRWFEELVFCILTANSSAERGLRCVKALKERGHVFQGSVDAVRKTLQDIGHRYPKKRAEYMILARKRSKELKEKVMRFGNALEAREWLVKEIMGIGWKEGSHFLRNVGFLNVAIIDRHVLRVMFEYGLVPSETRILTKRKYLEYEGVLREVSKQLNMPLGKLDLFLWYMKTGKVLK